MPRCVHSPGVRRLGIGSAIGLLLLARVLLLASVMVFVAIAIAARGLDYNAAVHVVSTDPLPLAAAQLAALTAIIALGLWLWTPSVAPGPALGLVRTPARLSLLGAIAGLSLQLPMVELTTLLVRLVPAMGHPPDVDAAVSTLTRISSPLRAFSVPFAFVVIAPVTEELLFRGLILRALRARHGRAPAIVGSALLFGAFHFDPQALVFATLVGLVLGYVADRSQSTMPSIAMHAGFNALPILLPVDLVRIPGFNTDSPQDVPWPLLLGSSALAAITLAVLFRLLARVAKERDQTS